jgi:hypothetical protein
MTSIIDPQIRTEKARESADYADYADYERNKKEGVRDWILMI